MFEFIIILTIFSLWCLNYDRITALKSLDDTLISSTPNILNPQGLKEIEDIYSGALPNIFDESVLVEYPEGSGKECMISWYEYLYIWPQMNREQRRLQMREVDPKDQIIVEVQGKSFRINRPGTSAAAKQQKKFLKRK